MSEVGGNTARVRPYLMSLMCLHAGSGSLAAMSVFEDRFKENMEVCRLVLACLAACTMQSVIMLFLCSAA